MTGHPTYHGALSVKSDLWVFAPDLVWVRTMSHFYRLGMPANSGRPQ
jgi:hypothetical protein